MSSGQLNENLFDDSRMSFGQHLEELRKVLIRSLMGVAVACVFGFFFANGVIDILTQPLVDAIEKYDRSDAESQLVDGIGFVPPEYMPWIKNEGYVPQQYLIDPGQLVRALQTTVPDLGTKIDLEPYSFRSHHFDQAAVPQLCQRLSQQNGDDDAMVEKLSALWEVIDQAGQATISEIASLEKATDQNVDELVAVFNRAAAVDRLNDSGAFKDWLVEGQFSFWEYFQPPKEKPLAKMKLKLDQEPDPILSARLNRALITSLFPDQMQVLKLDLVPIELWEKSEFEPQSLSVTEPFTVWLKAGLFTGLVLAGPWVFWQLWSFVAAGLYPHEQKYIHIFLPISIALFVAGVLLAFFFVFQPVLGFLFSFNRAMGIAPEMRINDWLSFVMFLPLGFGVAFQLPLVMLFMNRIGLFSADDYLSKWRMAVMIIFVLAMFLTPADPISMLLLAVPLTFLYFLGVGMCIWMPRSSNPFGDVATN